MDKHDVAAVLENIGALLELCGENPFKTRAYVNGARIVETLEGDLDALVANGEIRNVKGIGPALAETISTLVTTGALPYYDELKAKVPRGLFDLTLVPGLGVRKARILNERLGIDSLDALEAACREGKIRELSGFGARTEEKIRESLGRMRTAGQRVLYPAALAEGERLLEVVRAVPGVVRAEIAGSVRRHGETAKDVDVVCAAPADAAPQVMERFATFAGVAAVLVRGETKTSVRLVSGMNADLRVVREDAFAAALAYFTGSKDHNVAMRGRAGRLGYKLNEYGLFRGDEPVPLAGEEALYEALGLAYVLPELREGMGEIEAAERRALPPLIEQGDIRGLMHVHSVWSDGVHSLEAMVTEAEHLGYEYVGLTEHSQTAFYANGLKPDRLLRWLDEADALNAAPGRRIRILKGTECDILADGALDWSPDLLARFDFVVASIHSRFKMERDEMTARILTAVRNPFTTILGHPTGRLLLRREPYDVDMEAVIQEAARHGVAVELNACPDRLDVDWRLGPVLRRAGARVSIDPDAHSTSGLRDVEVGVGIARKAWMRREDVLNALPLDQMLAWLAERRRHALEASAL